MRRLLTGYAITFNKRHNRVGHLFQNRYKSIVCEEDAYLLELVRYIHPNPLRARIVKSMDELDRYPWSGHAVLMGNRQIDGQSGNSSAVQWGEHFRKKDPVHFQLQTTDKQWGELFKENQQQYKEQKGEIKVWKIE